MPLEGRSRLTSSAITGNHTLFVPIFCSLYFDGDEFIHFRLKSRHLGLQNSIRIQMCRESICKSRDTNRYSIIAACVHNQPVGTVAAREREVQTYRKHHCSENIPPIRIAPTSYISKNMQANLSKRVLQLSRIFLCLQLRIVDRNQSSEYWQSVSWPYCYWPNSVFVSGTKYYKVVDRYDNLQLCSLIIQKTSTLWVEKFRSLTASVTSNFSRRRSLVCKQSSARFQNLQATLSTEPFFGDRVWKLITSLLNMHLILRKQVVKKVTGTTYRKSTAATVSTISKCVLSMIWIVVKLSCAIKVNSGYFMNEKSLIRRKLSLPGGPMSVRIPTQDRWRKRMRLRNQFRL